MLSRLHHVFALALTWMADMNNKSSQLQNLWVFNCMYYLCIVYWHKINRNYASFQNILKFISVFWLLLINKNKIFEILLFDNLYLWKHIVYSCTLIECTNSYFIHSDPLLYIGPSTITQPQDGIRLFYDITFPIGE